MKTIIFILLFAFLQAMNAQNYLHLSSTWKEYTISCGGGNPYCTSQDYSITLGGDTSINNILYLKTIKSGVQHTWDWTVDTLVEQLQFSIPLQPIREENGIFYRYNSFSNNETVFHNFNLLVGDTAFSTCNTPQIVASIDTIFIGNIPRKRFTFINNGLNYLLEGIGSTKGLLSTPCNELGIESSRTLQCFSQENQYFPVDSSIACGDFVLVQENIKTEPLIVISPNPSHDYVDISLKYFDDRDIVIEVVNMQGNILIEERVSKLNGMNKIWLKKLPTGIYIVRVRGLKNAKPTKMIITR